MLGRGCPPSRTVTVRLDGTDVGTGAADRGGGFDVPFDVPDLAPGRYPVEADCGPVLRTTLDVVLISRVSNGGSQFALLVFFMLSVVGLYRRRRRWEPAS